MKKILRIIGFILYHTIGRHLPLSGRKINFGSKAFRALCAKMMFIHCGKNANIDKNARIWSEISI